MRHACSFVASPDENPEACTFKLASLPACANDVATDGCVTRAQRAALAAFTTPPAADTLRYPGWPFGDEADPEGRETWMTGPVAAVIELTARTAPTFHAFACLWASSYLRIHAWCKLVRMCDLTLR